MIPMTILGMIIAISWYSFGEPADDGWSDHQVATFIFGVLAPALVLLVLLGCGVHNYCKSLELVEKRQDAITAVQAVKKSHNYSRKELVAEGELAVGKLNVRYGAPAIRHKIEQQAVWAIREYNSELARMKGAKRGWLWTPGWGYSSVVDTMKPIDVPEMR